MTNNKNQHFVPRVYLKSFSRESKGLAINLFNLEREKLIINAPLKNQCSKDYFYGTDKILEEAIQSIEAGYGQVLRNLIQNVHTFAESKAILRAFWLFQHVRTEAAAIRAVELADSIKNLAGLPPNEYSLEIKEAVQIACKNFAGSMNKLDDLKFCLLKNKTSVPFITSDNPAVLTNKWHFDLKETTQKSFGLESAGLLVLLPLTPNLYFLGYDGDVYSVPNERGIAEIHNARDIVALNRHQYLHCLANVYVHDTNYEKLLLNHYSAIAFARPKARHVLRYAQFDHQVTNYIYYKVVSVEERDQTKEAMMHFQVIHPDPKIWPSQIQIRKNRIGYTNGKGGYIRRSATFTISRQNFSKVRI